MPIYTCISKNEAAIDARFNNECGVALSATR